MHSLIRRRNRWRIVRDAQAGMLFSSWQSVRFQ